MKCPNCETEIKGNCLPDEPHECPHCNWSESKPYPCLNQEKGCENFTYNEDEVCPACMSRAEDFSEGGER